MKRRNKEINIFSMSALDLFASALGAFILIAIVLFPYFPNIGDSPERVGQMKKELAAAKAQRDQAEAELAKAKEELSEIKIPDIDLVIALDISGSMRGEIAGLKDQIDELAVVLDKLAPSVGIGVIAFGDRLYDSPLTVQDVLEITASASIMRQLQNFITNIEPNMGFGSGDNPDGPEAVDLALKRAIDHMSWRSKAQRRYIVVITDNAAYPEKVETTYRMARQFSSTANSSVSTVLGSNSSSDAHSYLRDLASAGKGKFVIGHGILSAILTAILG